MPGLLIAYLLTLLLAHCSHYLLPGSLWPVKRNKQLWLLQTAVVTPIYLLALALTLRPCLAAIITLALLAVLLIINQAKYRALREPLVFSDVYLYLQVIRHPRLFLPFLNVRLVLTAILAGLCLFYIAVQIEPSVLTTGEISTIQLYLGSALIIGLCACLVQALTEKCTLSFIADQDVRTLGFYNSLIIYILQARDKERQKRFQQKLSEKSPFTRQQGIPAAYKKPQKSGKPADIIVIQSESFFDPRPMLPAIKKNVLKHFDQTCDEASSHGSLTVPAWGANTLRTEFAFLSSIDNRELEHYRFNPYQYLSKPIPTLASYLKAQGYRCIAIHPNDAKFFKRNKVFPLMGFDEFIDLDEFNDDDTDGPYISDAAVAQKIDETLNKYNSVQPIFLFVITMENHGPLHLENAAPEKASALYQGQTPKHHHDLSVYLRHLSNADAMLQKLIKMLNSRKRTTILGFYGDHVPSMPDVYDQLGYSDTHTKYLIWAKDK